MTPLLWSLLAQAERCKHQPDDCRSRCRRCARGREHQRRQKT